MAEIEDVLDKLEDVLNKIDDVQERVGEVENKFNVLMDPTKSLKIWTDCTKCHGDGKVLDIGVTGLDPQDIGGVVTPDLNPNPLEIECPACKGAKRLPWGWQETIPKE